MSAPGLSDDDVHKLSHLHVPVPLNEQHRLRILRQTQIMGSSPNEEVYDRIVHICARVFKSTMSSIAIVDLEEAWIKSQVGHPERRLDRNLSICSTIILETTDDVLIIPDATQDERFAHFPVVQAGIRFYAGAAIVCAGVKLGALAILSTSPNFNFSASDAVKLRGLADVVAALIDQRRHSFLDYDDHATTLVVGSSYSLKQPLQAVWKEKEQLRKVLYSTSTDSGERVQAAAAFDRKVQWLLNRGEMAIETAYRYSHVMGLRLRSPTCASTISTKETFNIEHLQASLIKAVNLAKDTCQGVSIRYLGFDNIAEIRSKLETVHVVLGWALASDEYICAKELQVDVCLVPALVTSMSSMSIPPFRLEEYLRHEAGTLRISVSTPRLGPLSGVGSWTTCKESLAEVILQANSGWIERREDHSVCSFSIYLPCLFRPKQQPVSMHLDIKAVPSVDLDHIADTPKTLFFSSRSGKEPATEHDHILEKKRSRASPAHRSFANTILKPFRCMFRPSSRAVYSAVADLGDEHNAVACEEAAQKH